MIHSFHFPKVEWHSWQWLVYLCHQVGEPLRRKAFLLWLKGSKTSNSTSFFWPKSMLFGQQFYVGKHIVCIQFDRHVTIHLFGHFILISGPWLLKACWVQHCRNGPIDWGGPRGAREHQPLHQVGRSLFEPPRALLAIIWKFGHLFFGLVSLIYMFSRESCLESLGTRCGRP